jgi:hypothetical protein
MNTKLSTVNNDYADELRELSHSEQIQASGGRQCYINPPGRPNPTRYRSQNFGIFFERWNTSTRRYDIVSSFGFSPQQETSSETPFSDFCRTNGYSYIRD